MRDLRMVCMVIVLALGGCVSAFPTPDHELTGFNERVAAAEVRDLRVVYVHGINCHGLDYSGGFQARVASALGFERDATILAADGTTPALESYVIEDVINRDRINARNMSASARQLIADPVDEALADDNWQRGLSAPQARRAYERALDRRLEEERFNEYDNLHNSCVMNRNAVQDPLDDPRVSVRRFNRADGARLTFIEVLWSPLSERRKRELLGFDFGPEPSDYADAADGVVSYEQRAYFNESLKSGLLNPGFSDAVFYVGDNAQYAQDIARFGLCMALHGSGSVQADARGIRPCQFDEAVLGESVDNAQYLFVSESLGSRVLFDTIVTTPGLSIGLSSAFDRMFTADPQVVFFANQLPLLSMADDVAARTDIEFVGTRLSVIADGSAQVLQRLDRAFASYGQDGANSRGCVQGLLALRSLRDGPHHGVIFAPPARADFASLPVTEVREVVGQRFALLDALVGVSYRACRLALWDIEPITFGRMGPDTDQARDFLTLGGVLSAHSDINAFDDRAAFDLLVEYHALQDVMSWLVSDACRVSNCLDGVEPRLRSEIDRRRQDVLVFSDPNDLLNYQLVDQRSVALQFTNIPVRNARPLIPVNGPWGLYADAEGAHTNYEFNDTVIEWIVGAEDSR